MNEESGALDFATVVDTSGYDEGLQHMEDATNNLVTTVENKTSQINELLNDIPEINLQIVGNVSNLGEIETALRDVDRVVKENTKGVRLLEERYKNLADARKQLADKSQKGGAEDVKLHKEQQAVLQVIDARKKAIAEANKQGNALRGLQADIQVETEAVEENATAQVSLRQRIRELINELVEMEAAGQRGTAQYRATQEEVARLTDAFGDARAQATILANDQRGFAGISSGLTGMMGAFSAATGVVSLFGSENVALQKIMTKVQAVMAITMGLQQVQTMLNKDSAFSLVTLNGIKEWWNKLVAIGIGEQEMETAATVTNTVAQEANAGASVLNATAHEGKAVAATGSAAAEGVDTAATVTNTVAAEAGTIANIGLAGAFRMVSAAIKSIPVFGWIVAAISAIISVISYFVESTDDAKESTDEFAKSTKKMVAAQKEANEMLKDARKTYIENDIATKTYIETIDNFNGSLAEEKKLISELNSKYGEQMGYCSTLSGWKDQLIKKSSAYCDMLFMEAEAQAILSKAVDIYVKKLELETSAKLAAANPTKSFFSADAYRILAEGAEKELEELKAQYSELIKKKNEFMRANGLGFHSAPSSSPAKTNSTSSTPDTKINADTGSHIDPKKAAKEAAETYQKAYDEYMEKANDKVRSANLKYMSEGLEKMLQESDAEFEAQRKEWDDMLMSLALANKQKSKDIYASKHDGKTDGWEKTPDGGKTDLQWRKELLEKEVALKQQYDAEMLRLEERKLAARAKINTDFLNSMVEQYGTIDDKIKALETSALSIYNQGIPPQFAARAEKEIENQISALKSEKFKNVIDWDSVFADIDKQNISVLQYNLDRINKFFSANKASMSADQIKEYQDAIEKLSDEIDSRNPFVQLHNSIKNIAKAKTEYTNALSEFTNAQGELDEATKELNEAMDAANKAEEEYDKNKSEDNLLNKTAALSELGLAQKKYDDALERTNKAEKNVLSSRNGITKSYSKFAANLKNVGGVVSDVGGKAKNLAKVFSDDVSDSIEKAIDFVTDMLDVTGSVINAIGDVGKGVAKGVESAVDASAQGVKTAAGTAATSISTIEKASIILTIISAALQVATAIANLFNNDDAKQKEIDKLQERIDQLQWELDNAETTRLMDNVGSAVENLKKLYEQTYWSVLNLHGITQQSSMWSRWLASARYEGEIYRKTVEALADAYASVDYTANKALGANKYTDSRKQLENYSEQMLLIQKQIDEEASKKKTDDGKIQDWKNQMEEIANDMANLINDMLEDIIGSSAEDLAKTLGDAFVEAAQQGEDAMKAWHDKVNELVADILKRMLITKFLEEPLGEIFNRYKKKWFGDDGQFKGIDAVINSMQGFSDDLNKVGEDFQNIWNALPDNVKDWFPDESEREGQQRGIATASQDSVDENNARLTTIQSHTYNIQQGLVELNHTTNAILDKVTGIEKNTSDANYKLDEMNDRVRKLNNTVNEIQTHGIKLK